MKNLLVLLVQAHGCDTPGKCSPDKRLMEWKYSREICRMIKSKLFCLGIDCIIINPEDKDVKLAESAKMANEIYEKEKYNYENIVLLSPHVNAAPGSGWSNASGWMGYVYTNAGKDSRKLCKYLADRAYDRFNLQGNRYIPEERFCRANFAILRQTKMAAVLTENMFMTNKDDVNFLLSDEGKEKITMIHVLGLLEYMQKKMVEK